MASRRTEKQQLMKDYELLHEELQYEGQEEQEEDWIEDLYWFEYERYKMEQKNSYKRDSLCDDFENCWPDDDYDPYDDVFWDGE